MLSDRRIQAVDKLKVVVLYALRYMGTSKEVNIRDMKAKLASLGSQVR